MGSQEYRIRNGTGVFFGEDEPEERMPNQFFCKEIRDFKNHSRSFHEFYAQAEGAHNPRSFGRDERNILEMVVMDACHYPNRYEGKKEWSKSEKAECSAIADKILGVHKLMGNRTNVKLEVVFLTMYQYSCKETSVVPLFKVYGNGGDSTFISKNTRQYDSLYSFLDNNNLPHSLVCAAREGQKQTYEIDRVINKYPLVFFTVNYSKCVDRTSEHARVWSTVLKNTIVLDFPFLLVQAFFEHIRIEVKYFTSNINWNKITPGSAKYKFYKFMDDYKDVIPLFGTFVNQAIIMGVAYSVTHGKSADEELLRALLLNGDASLKCGNNFLLSHIIPSSNLNLLDVPPLVFHDSFPGFSLGKECYFKELIGQFKESNVGPRTVSDCSDVIQELCVLGQKLLDGFALVVTDPKWKLIYLGLRVVLRIVPLIAKKLINGSKKLNYIEAGVENTFSTPEDGDYSLEGFIKTMRREKDILQRLSMDENVKSVIEDECRKYPAYDSKLICINAEENAYISLAPISSVMEKLLQDSRKNARVYASEDESFYEISSEERLYKIYPFKNDESDMEIQYIHVGGILSRSEQKNISPVEVETALI